ncbi:PLC-like phosphodiesterase [Cladochytrium replicatum]|nr:PLC-like phosphodiesterase [Cladochytrium replicatum]
MLNFLVAAAAAAALFASAPLASAQSCNGAAALCSKQYTAVSFACTHNSYAVATSSPPQSSANQVQNFSLKKQWEWGYRCFNLDLFNNNGTIHLCHTTCLLLDAGPLTTWLKDLKTLVDANPNDVVTIHLENSGTPALAPSTIAAAFTAAGLTSSYFYSAGGTDPSTWPTLSALVAQKTRIVAFLGANSNPTAVPQLLDYNALTAETNYAVFDAAGLSSCAQFRPTTGDRPLFIVNHMLSKSIFGPGASDLYQPEFSTAASVNSAANITAQLTACTARGVNTVNYLFLDWGHIGAGLSVVAGLNGVAAPTTPDPSTLNPATTSTSTGAGNGVPRATARGVASMMMSVALASFVVALVAAMM